MVDRKIHAMHKRYGIDWENTCKGCSHLISGEWHGDGTRAEDEDWDVDDED